MKQHYKTLQVPRNATLDEIKEKYRRLAREYHPDKFQQGEEKYAAEERFIEITEAYNGLKRSFKSSMASGYIDPNQPPTPILSQTLLDFGTMHTGTRKTITFIVQNDGGPVESVRFDYDKARGWLKVNESISHNAETMKFPLEIEVTVDTEMMDPLRTYQDKIDIWLNDQMARVTLVAGVKEQPKILAYLSTISPQFIALMLFLVATACGIFALAKTHEGPVIFADELQSTVQQIVTPSSEAEVPNAISAANLFTEEISAKEIPTKEILTANASIIKATALEAADIKGYNIERRSELDLLEMNRPLVFSKGSGQKMLYVMHELLDEPYSLKINGYSPIWSPQKQQIAFLRDTEGGIQIFVAAIRATKIDALQKEQRVVFTVDKPMQLTDSEQMKNAILWSPSGEQIAFREQLTNDDGDSFEILKAVEVVDGSTRLLSIPSQGNVSHFAWTSDSKTLFATFNSDESEKVYTVDIESGFAEPFVQFESRDAAWSPDGQQIAIASNQGLYLLDKNKENVRRLSTFSNWEPSWSPDGSRLAFLGSAERGTTSAALNRAAISRNPAIQDVAVQNVASRDSADLWIFDVSTEQITRLTTAGALDFTWGPTEELVYTTAGEDRSKKTLQMWSLELDGQTEIVDEVGDPQIAWVSQ